MPHLQMMGMTMVFKADPALLQGLGVGQAVRFKAQREGGQLTVTAIEKR
jgi:Cu/Ag efflux protein CusF